MPVGRLMVRRQKRAVCRHPKQFTCSVQRRTWLRCCAISWSCTSHDLSEIFPIELGPEGRFGYDKLPLYWAEPALHHAFLIKDGNNLAGFAFATRGSPASEDPEDLDVAEFFVLRGHRRSGVGRQAAMALWDGVPGHWVVRVSEANRAGLPFWSEVIRSYTSGHFVESARPEGWRVFKFASTASGPGVAARTQPEGMRGVR